MNVLNLKRLGLISTAGVFLVSFSATACAVPDYVLDLGTLGGSLSNAWGISKDARTIVGSSLNGSGLTQAFRSDVASDYLSTSMTGLSFLSGGTEAQARAVSSAGVIAGYSTDSGAVRRAVVWNGITPTLISGLSGAGYGESRAYGISDTGTVVGSVVVNGVKKVFTSTSGVTTLLNLDPASFDPGGDAEAFGISPDGRYIVGRAAAVTVGEMHGFIYDTTDPLANWDVASSANTSINGVHNLHATGGDATGLGFVALNSTGSADGGRTESGDDAVGFGVNKQGYMVGTGLSGLGNYAIYGDGPILHNLNDRFTAPAFSLTSATGIADVWHDAGIVGSGTFGGQTHAYFMVPEPASMITIGVGLCALACRRRAR